MAKALAEQGYARATVEDVIENAGTSRKTFYEFFDDKEACLLAAYDAASERLWEVGAEAAAGAGEWPARVRAAVAAALELLRRRALHRAPLHARGARRRRSARGAPARRRRARRGAAADRA